MTPSRKQALLPTGIVLALLGVYYCFFATMIVLDRSGSAGPDEIMRLLVPKAMLRGNLLPSGYDSDTILAWGNWSYAFYPQMLGAYVTSVFMGVARLFGAGPIAQLYAARLSSVMWGLVGAFFVGKSVRTLLAGKGNEGEYGAFAALFVGLWPQYAFLSSYVNNDIIGLAGVSILICALIVGIKRGWELTSAAMLAVGIVVCALGYYCTYGFILAGIVTFIISCLSQNRDDLAHAWKTIGLTALVCALCTFPFFGVNIVRYGDPIGSRAFGQAYEKWLADGGEVVRWPANTGFVSLILNEDYIDRTTKSFIGMFGYLSEPLHEIVRLFLGATLVFLSGALFGCRELASRVFSKRWRVFSISLIVAALITVAMHLWYSNGTDYEPQGRYVIDLLVPWCVMAGIGAFCIFGSSRLGLGICAAVYTMICVGSVLLVMRNGAWPGIMASQDMYLNMVIP